MRIEISPKAFSDLDDIFNFSLRQWGDVQANQYIERVFARLDLLSDSPKLGRRVERMPPEVRVLRTEQHSAYYQVRVDHIWVMRVLHPKQRADLALE